MGSGSDSTCGSTAAGAVVDNAVRMGNGSVIAGDAAATGTAAVTGAAVTGAAVAATGDWAVDPLERSVGKPFCDWLASLL